MNMKKLITLLIAVLFFSCVSFADADTLDEEYNRQYQNSGLEQVVESLPDDVIVQLAESGIDLSSGNIDINIDTILNVLTNNIFIYIKAPLSVLGIILTMLMLCSIFKNFINNQNIQEIFVYASSVILCCCIVVPLESLIQRGINAIKISCGFIVALIPVYASIFISSGQIKTAASCNIVFIAGQVIEGICTVFFSPFVGIYTSVSIASSLYHRLNLSLIMSTAKKYLNRGLCFLVTVYTALLSITQILSSASDSVSQRVGKYIVGSSIPVIGGVVSESLGILMGALTQLKASVGIYALFAIVLINIPVIMEVFLWQVALSICSFVAESFCLNRSHLLIDSIKDGIGIILSVCFTSLVILLISLSILTIGGRAV